MSANLTKKQQKALAFRQRSKKKLQPEDIPEQDIVEEDNEDEIIEQSSSNIASSSKEGVKVGKKRKRNEEAVKGDEGVSKMDLTDGIKGKLKDVGKGKGKWEGHENEGETTKKSKKEVKQRFILFVGELTRIDESIVFQ